MNPDIELAAFAAVESLRVTGLSVATAESCTGGMIATAITEVPGASAVFRYGWVTYCNEAKEELLGVPPLLIEQFSVVSEPVVAAMAESARLRARADMAAAHLPLHTETLHLPHRDRATIRRLVTLHALNLIIRATAPAKS